MKDLRRRIVAACTRVPRPLDTDDPAPDPPEHHAPHQLEEPVADLFDATFYADRYGCHEEDAWSHYALHGDRANYSPSPYFDTAWYRDNHPHGANEECRALPGLLDFLHHLDKGIERQVSPFIDPDFYRARHPQIGDAPAWVHFVRHGDNAGWRPSREFDASFYGTTYLPLGTTCPLRHYVEHGNALGFLPAPREITAKETTQEVGRLLAPGAPVIVTHNAQRGGGPMTARLIAAQVAAQGPSPLVVALEAGPLLESLQAVGPVVVLAEGWHREALWDAIPTGTPIVLNTACCAQEAVLARRSGHDPLLLIHEFPDGIEDLGLTQDIGDAVAADVRFGFALESSEAAFATAFSPLRGEVVGIAPYEPRPTQKEYADARVRLRPDGDLRPVVAGAGNADQRKGFDIFLRTAHALHERRVDVRVVWFGALDPWAQGLASEARSNGLPLELPGHVEPFQAWLASCDVLLVTSRSDVGPGTVLYAGLEGIPTVAYDTELGTREYIERLGALVPSEDVAACVTAVCRLLPRDGEDDDMRRSRRAARRKEAAPFTSKRYLENLLDRRW